MRDALNRVKCIRSHASKHKGIPLVRAATVSVPGEVEIGLTRPSLSLGIEYECQSWGSLDFITVLVFDDEATSNQKHISILVDGESKILKELALWEVWKWFLSHRWRLRWLTVANHLDGFTFLKGKKSTIDKDCSLTHETKAFCPKLLVDSFVLKIYLEEVWLELIGATKRQKLGFQTNQVLLEFLDFGFEILSWLKLLCEDL